MMTSIFFAAWSAAAFTLSLSPRVDTVRTGLDVVLSDSVHVLQGKRVGLITNHSGLDRAGRRNIDLLYHAPGVKLVALFGPEHGLAGVVRDWTGGRWAGEPVELPWLEV